MVHIQLVKAAVNGDENAFEKLIKSESDRLYRTAFLYVHNKEDALDVLQETVYKAFVSINRSLDPVYRSRGANE
ncbi:MAG: hypothetical protein ACO1OC_02955 [Tuberibacillus sp.]